MSIGTRNNQQDSVRFDHNEFSTVCVVCDGMGGLSGGERASALAAQGMTQHLLENAQATDISTEMDRAALRLNEKVKDIRDSENRKMEAGTTLTAVFIRNGELFWCGIGDSHIYLYRAGELRQLNIDHNFGVHLDQMVQEGSITTEEALQCSCFFNKALFSILKLTTIFFACQGNRAIRHSALNQIGRKILLDAAA